MTNSINISQPASEHPEFSLSSPLPSSQNLFSTYEGPFIRRIYEETKMVVEIGRRTLYDGHGDFGRSSLSESTAVSADVRPNPLRIHSTQMPAQIPKGYFQKIYPIPPASLTQAPADQVTSQVTLNKHFSLYEQGTRYEFALAPSVTTVALPDYECSVLKGTGENSQLSHSIESSSDSIPALVPGNALGTRFNRWITGNYSEQLNLETVQIVSHEDGSGLKLACGNFQRKYPTVQSVTDFPDLPASSAVPVPNPTLSVPSLSPSPLVEETQQITFFNYIDLLQKRERMLKDIASNKQVVVTTKELQELIKLEATLKKFPLALPLTPSPLPVTLEADPEEGLDPITAEELDYLIQTFPNCRKIYFGDTQIEDPAVLLTKITQLKNLTAINFSKCTFKERDFEELEPVALPQLKNLEIANCEKFGRVLLSKIIQAPQLQTLLIVDQDNLTEGDFRSLSRFNQLKNTEFRACEITAEKLSLLPPSVTYVELDLCTLESFPVKTADRVPLPHLQTLIFSSCDSLSVDLASLVNSYPELNDLSIDSTNLRNIQPHLPTLTFSNDPDSTWSYSFDTSLNTTLVYTDKTAPDDPWVFSGDLSKPTPVLTDQALQKIRPQYNLETLRVCAGEGFSAEGFNRLSQVFPNLRSLEVDQGSALHFEQRLEYTNTSLQKLILIDPQVQGETALRNLLNAFSHLQELILVRKTSKVQILTQETCKQVQKEFPTLQIKGKDYWIGI